MGTTVETVIMNGDKYSCLNYAIIICLILQQQQTNYYADAQNARIVGGSVANISDHPYLMQLHVNGRFICGGSLISARHVLTAAHCVQGLKESSLLVIGGSSYSTTAASNEPVVRRRVERIIVPQAYNAANMHMDVALLKLVQDMQGGNIEQVELCNVTLKAGESIRIAGWGRLKESTEEASLRLRTAIVPLMPRAQCQRLYKGYATISRSMFCASKPGISDACSGDSGGPAVYKQQICGIVSWGIGCARKKYPGVYTNVKTVRPFIQQALKL